MQSNKEFNEEPNDEVRQANLIDFNYTSDLSDEDSEIFLNSRRKLSVNQLNTPYTGSAATRSHNEGRIKRDRARIIEKTEREYNQSKLEYKHRIADVIKFVYKPQEFGLCSQHEAYRTHRNLLLTINTDEVMLKDPYFMKDCTAKLKTIDLRKERELIHQRAWNGLQADLRSGSIFRPATQSPEKSLNKTTRLSESTNKSLKGNSPSKLSKNFSYDNYCSGNEDFKDIVSAEDLYREAEYVLSHQNITHSSFRTEENRGLRNPKEKRSLSHRFKARSLPNLNTKADTVPTKKKNSINNFPVIECITSYLPTCKIAHK